ncbi:MAG: hypothetical protein ACJAS4_000127 [Bacteriovoracaceae bacterium]
MKYTKIITLILFFQALLVGQVFSAPTSGNRIFKNINLDKLDYREIQTFRKNILNFVEKIEANTQYESKKTVFYKNFQSIVNYVAYAGTNENCFFGGWPSELIDGVCKAPWTHARGTPYEKGICSEDEFACNPTLFGTGQCVDTTGGGYKGLTASCESKLDGEQNADKLNAIFSNLQKDKKGLKNLTSEIEQYCQWTNGRGVKDDHKATCDSLTKQMDKLGKKQKIRLDPRKPVTEVAQPILRDNKAMSIVEACKSNYAEDNKGFWGSLLGSKRGLLEGVIKSGVDCSTDRKVDLSDGELKELEDDFENLGDAAKESNLLGYLNEESLEHGLSAYLKHRALFKDDKFLNDANELAKVKNTFLKKYPIYNLNKDVFNEKFDKAINESKKDNLKKLNRGDLVKTFKGFGEDFNKLCSDIEAAVKARIGKRPNVQASTRRIASRKKTTADLPDVKWDNKLQGLVQKANVDLARMVQNFTEKNKDSSQLLYSETFYEDVFGLDEKDTANKCATGELKQPVNLNEITEYNTYQATKEVKEAIVDDLDETEESFKEIRDGDYDDIKDRIDEYLKYKPYMLGEFMKSLKTEEDKVFFAKYTCQRAMDIYSGDKLMNVGILSGGIVVGAIAGFVTGGIASGFIAGAIVSGVEGVAVATYEAGEAQRITNGATLGLISNSIDGDQFQARYNEAGDRIFNAKLAVGGAIVAPLAHGVGTGVRVMKAAGNSASEVTDAATKVVLNKGDELVDYVDASGKVQKRVVSSTAKKNAVLNAVDRKKAIQGEYKDVLAKNNGKRKRQVDAIMNAHSHRSTRCVIGQCTAGQLKRKMQMMRAEGIPDDVIRDVLRKGYAGDSAEALAATTKVKKEIYETVTSSIDEVTRAKRVDLPTSSSNKVWSETVQDLGQSQERMVLTIEKTMPDGSVKKVTTFARYNGTDGEQIIFDTVEDGRFAINPKDPSIKVTNISVEQSSYVGSVYTKVDEAIYEANPNRVMSKLEGKSVIVKYADEDGDIMDIAGEVVKKDGATQIKYPNKYNPGQFYYVDTKKLGDITEIQRAQPKTSWSAKGQHTRDIEESFPQGTDIQIQYRKPSSRYGSSEVTEEVMDGKYIGIVSDKVQGINVQQLVVRKTNGTLEYIDIKNLDGLNSAGNSVLEFNGGLLPQ